MKEIDNLTPETLPELTYKDQPMLTTELLAAVYGTDPNNIAANFIRNKERFQKGKHFYKLEGEELSRFKNEMTNCHFLYIGPKANFLYLWTERGAARHAKMLSTDKAWAVFERLEDSYFSGKSLKTPEKKLSGSSTSNLPFSELERSFLQARSSPLISSRTSCRRDWPPVKQSESAPGRISSISSG